MPTSCLGDARWVRAGIVAHGADLDEGGDAEVRGIYSDDANRDGTFDVERPALGPRVRRG